MTLQSQLKTAGILTYPDSVQQYDFRYLDQRINRSRRFQKARIEISKLPNDAIGVHEARLVLLSLIQPMYLDKAISGTPYRQANAVYLDWEVQDEGFHDDQKPRIERRRLTDLTVISIPNKASVPADGVSNMVRMLRANTAYRAIPESSVLEELGHDLNCWATAKLPGPLAAHLLGIQPFWATPRETLIRKSTFKRRPERSKNDSELELQKAVFEDAAMTTVASGRKGVDTTIIESSLKILTSRAGETDAQTLERWTADYLQLKTNIQYADCHTAVIVAWQFNLIESGTANQVDAVPQTRSGYIKQLTLPLLSTLRIIGGDPSNWTEEKLIAAYTAMIFAHQGDRRKFCAALNDFQLYCHETWGTPYVQINASIYVPPPRPRTQIVHAHEVAKAVLFLETYQGGDQRLLQSSALMLRLFYQAPFRLNELGYIRMGNIKFNEEKTEAWVEVYPCRENGLKSPSAERPLQIIDVTSVERLISWVDKRRLEGAKDGDFVFGKKAGKGLYRKALAAATIRSVLKAVTGDPGMTIHALRHTYATRMLSEIFQNSNALDTNRLNQLAHDMGHVSISTTIHFYAHEYSDVLHFLGERATRKLIEFSAPQAANVVGSTADAVRQIPARNGLSIDAYAKNHIATAAIQKEFPPPLNHDEWIDATCPELSRQSQSELTLLKVLEIAVSLSLADPPNHDDIANVHDVSRDLVDCASTALQTLGLRLSMTWRTNRRQKFGPIDSTLKAIAALQFSPKDILHPKYAALLRRMADQTWTTDLEDLAKTTDLLIFETYVNVSSPLASARLFSYLKVNRVEATSLCVTVQCDDEQDPAMLAVSGCVGRRKYGGVPHWRRQIARAPKGPGTSEWVPG
jgi:integrase